MKQTMKHVTDYGGQGKVILLLHGFLASSKYWKKLQPRLTKTGFRVITVDLLGFGNAPKPRHMTYDYQDHVAHINEVISHLAISEPLTIVGHSMGALIAARYATLQPGNVCSLILLHPPLYKDSLEAINTLGRTNMIYKILLQSRFRRLGWVIVKTIAYSHVGRHSRTARERSLRNIIQAAEAFNDLQKLQTRTLLIVGTKDRVEYMNNVSNHTISSSVTLIKEPISHHSPILEPQLIQRRIVQFINQ